MNRATENKLALSIITLVVDGLLLWWLITSSILVASYESGEHRLAVIANTTTINTPSLSYHGRLELTLPNGKQCSVKACNAFFSSDIQACIDYYIRTGYPTYIQGGVHCVDLSHRNMDYASFGFAIIFNIVAIWTWPCALAIVALVPLSCADGMLYVWMTLLLRRPWNPVFSPIIYPFCIEPDASDEQDATDARVHPV